MRFKNTILLLTVLMISAALKAQNNTSSPYSRYGLGLLDNTTFGRGQAMGGSGIALRSNKYINPVNPASFSSIDTLSQIYEFGFSAKIAQFKDGDQSQVNNDANFSYLGMAFPISKNMGIALGVQPLSNIGYSYYLESEQANIGSIQSIYNGTGGINKAYIGFSANLMHGLSLGVNLNYLFGSVLHNRTVAFPDDEDISTFFSSENVSVGAVHPVFGAQYLLNLNSNNNLIIGGIYEPKTTLNAKQDLSSVKELAGLTARTIALQENKSIGIDMPEAYGFGLTYEHAQSITITGDYYIQNWSQSEYYNTTDTLGNQYRLSAGVEYIPNLLSRNYFNRVEYRLGGNYSNNYIKGLNGDLYTFGMTFGLGLPLRFEKTRFNITFELGQMKSSTSSLLSESYGKVTINFSFNDYWFFRRKLD